MCRVPGAKESLVAHDGPNSPGIPATCADNYSSLGSRPSSIEAMDCNMFCQWILSRTGFTPLKGTSRQVTETSQCHARHGFCRLATILLVIFPIMLLMPLTANAATSECISSHASDITKVLAFDQAMVHGAPGGWQLGGAAIQVSTAPDISHDGQKSLLLERRPGGAAKHLSVLNTCIKADFVGNAITLQGYVRTQQVENGQVYFGVNENGGNGIGVLLQRTTYGENLHGTHGWEEFSIPLPYRPDVRSLTLGIAFNGIGKAWVSGLQVLVDGKPIWEAPQRKLATSILEMDQEFSNGSDIHITKLDKTQIANLITLGKVWGFLKYYDPTVTSGEQQWDFALFRVMPTILTAQNRQAADAALLSWIKKLGPVKPCDACIRLNTKDLYLRPNLQWIHDTGLLGTELSSELQNIYKNRETQKQFYITLAPEAKNAVFTNELPYKSIRFPDSGFQLLALYRFWNIIEYWYPYRKLIGESWDSVLTESVPKFALAGSRKDYELQLMRLIAEIHDSHANLWSSTDAFPPAGKCYLPVRIRYIQGVPVVAQLLNSESAKTSPFRVGDVLLKLDGRPISALFTQWSPYYGASNQAALQRDIATTMTRGKCGPLMVGVRRAGRGLEVQANRIPLPLAAVALTKLDLPGPTFRLLSPEVAYLKLSSVKADKVADYIRAANGTKGLIIDIRNYPAQTVVYSLGD